MSREDEKIHTCRWFEDETEEAAYAEAAEGETEG